MVGLEMKLTKKELELLEKFARMGLLVDSFEPEKEKKKLVVLLDRILDYL